MESRKKRNSRIRRRRFRSVGSNAIRRRVFGSRLRKRDIRTQFICPPPPLIAAPGHAADAALARRLNTSTARLVAARNGVLAGLAAPAIGEPPNAAAELREAIEQYGFKGVVLPTSAGNLSLDNPAFDSFELIEDREMFAFVHPTGSSLSAHLRDFTLPIIIGWPTETAVCVARLVRWRVGTAPET